MSSLFHVLPQLDVVNMVGIMASYGYLVIVRCPPPVVRVRVWDPDTPLVIQCRLNIPMEQQKIAHLQGKSVGAPGFSLTHSWLLLTL